MSDRGPNNKEDANKGHPYRPRASVASQLNMQVSKKRSIERQDGIDESSRKTLDEIQAFIAYIEGAPIDDIEENFGIKPATLKYKIKKIKERGIEGLIDGREANGSYQTKKITSEIGQRIQELKIRHPSLSSREIAERLHKQDGLEVSHTIVNEYLSDVNLNDYTGSQFRDSVFPPQKRIY